MRVPRKRHRVRLQSGMALAMLAAVFLVSANGTAFAEESIFGVVPASTRKAQPPVKTLVDLNKASESDLMRLGLWPTPRYRIMAGRPYTQIKDLLDRSIVSRRDYERIKSRITVQR